MADWKEYYENHIVTAEEAANLIESGDRIWAGCTICVPYDELDVLTDRYEELEDVQIYTNVMARPLKMFTDPAKYKKAFHHRSYFPGPVEHAAYKMGMVSYLSVPYAYFPGSVKEQNINVVYTEVCPPSEDGTINLGAAGAFLGSEVIAAGTVTKLIGVINENHKPVKCEREGFLDIPVEKFDAFVLNTHAHLEAADGAPRPVDEQIANNIMAYVQDGDTVQVGKGALGNAIGQYLTQMNNVKVNSEILGDWIIPLCEKGIATEVRCAGYFGMKPLYDFCEAKDDIIYDSVTHMASIDEMSKHDTFVAINACMMADLTGQSASEGPGTHQHSCVGGQLDFCKGANYLRNQGKRGFNFLAFHATRTDKEGNLVSNVVFNFPPATAVSLPRSEAMYYATEYGVADLWGKTLQERAKAMIAIAHPDFREELTRKAIESGLLPNA